MFPGGYFLQDGQHKVFDGNFDGYEFQRVIRSPNGEDVLYVFHNRAGGSYVLFPYNMIRREVQNPIRCQGYSLFDDGRMVVFRFAGDEPTRVHPMQVWQTPFVSDEFAAKAPASETLLGKIGNADLVRGISDCLSIKRYVDEQTPSRKVYEDLIANLTRTIDAYYWLSEEAAFELKGVLVEIKGTAELIVDEFEKVVAIKKQAAEAIAAAQEGQEKLVRDLRPESWTRVDQYMDALTQLRTQRGHLITLKEMRYIDTPRIDELEAEVVEHFDRLSKDTVGFLLKEDSLAPLTTELDRLLERLQGVEKTNEFEPINEELDRVSDGLNVLSDVSANLQVDDPTARTRILEQISEVFAHQNRVRAMLAGRRKELLSAEGKAEFSAQFKLFGQSVQSAISLADTPEKCDEQLSRLMVQLEELEAKFSEFDEFIGELASKREEVYEAIGQKKQQLLDERQRRVQNLWGAAERILQGVSRRASAFKEIDQLNAYFASDAMILKLRDLAERILDLGDSVKSDEVQSKLKSAKQDALRGLRDRSELFADGADLIKFGAHRFTVNTQPLELTVLPKDDGMAVSISGTDFMEPITDEAFLATKDFWSQSLISETKSVYRGEYLAASILFDAEAEREGLSMAGLHEAQREEGGLLDVVRKVSGSRYQEGYERGVHDADATAILEKLVTLHDSAGLLRFAPTARAIGCLFWAFSDDERKEAWHRRAMSLGRLRAAFGGSSALVQLGTEIAEAVAAFIESTGLPEGVSHAPTTGRYLVEELAVDRPAFTTSAEASKLTGGLLEYLELHGNGRRALEDDLAALGGDVAAQYRLARAWLSAFLETTKDEAVAGLLHAVAEAAVVLLTERGLNRSANASLTSAQVGGLLGQHDRIEGGAMDVRIDEFLERLGAFKHRRVPGYQAYRSVRTEVIEAERRRLRIDEYKPRVLSSFVRNKLINEVYLPLIGDNLAKQLGAAGDTKRTDLMGLLLLISPPGYGKTTLMEYVASRLGLAFVKVNGPALGHSVLSIDPTEAPNATARQEVEKINLALEMGNNVMLYLDDIQHTNPELLQKFISLCDAQRRIEGVWNGRTRTYDLRGKKFCVVMAGNPYTEAGEKFQIPDMLSNRADTYNLGDILSGKGDAFALSYIENAITSNPVLAPLGTRAQSDIYKLVAMAQGEEVNTADLSHGYSAVEVGEIVAVFKHMLEAQKVLLAVNKQYIESASMDDQYRTEPRFQLQGSYRNMAKLAEKIVPAMNAEEINRLIEDHYVGEAQTLTSGAEHNLLKLGELRGTLTEEQAARWAQIKKDFGRVKLMGGGDDDPIARVTGQLTGLTDQLEGIQSAMQNNTAVTEKLAGIESAVMAAAKLMQAEAGKSNGASQRDAALITAMQQLGASVSQLQNPQLQVSIQNQPPPGVEELLAQQVAIIERTLVPLVRGTNENLGSPTKVDAKVQELLGIVRAMDMQLRGKQGAAG
ncbi:MAG: DNA repair ATPase, partial [Myxococcota bacterium]